MHTPWDDYEKGFGAFFPGQPVVAANAPDGSKFKRDQQYIVSAFAWKPSTNPIANGKSFWYIGIVGHAGGMPYFHPGMFIPITTEFIEISFSEVKEREKSTTCAN
jgi:hypothetical protein